tara:strand:- start:47 stop:829 length:783 start_codon:yes stop_codon:yes gene_type:complete
MFDKKKINFNHLRSHKNSEKNKRTKKFFDTISNTILERAASKINITKDNNILELAARNNSFYKILQSNGLEKKFIQTCLSSDINLLNKKRVIIDLNNQAFIPNFFDLCFSFFSINSSNNIPKVFNNIFNTLKPGGILLTVLPSNYSFVEFRNYFLNFFKPSKNYSFNPSLDIHTLGNIANSVGFKNIIVDKEDFKFTVRAPEDIWNFIRSTGESNYLKNRKDFFIKKSEYNKFYKQYKNELLKKNLVNNTFSLYFFIGNK